MSWTSCSRLVGLAVVSACGFQAPPGTAGDRIVDSSVDVYIPDAGPCQTLQKQCIGSGSTLRACVAIGQEPVDTSCSWGCSTDGEAHCGKLQPSGGVLTAADLDPTPQLLPVTIGSDGNVTIDTNTGEITGVRGPGQTNINGIEFSVRGTTGVFRASKITITGTGTILVKGTNALAMVSLTDVAIGATLDLRGTCTAREAGPGGFQGGDNGQSASGSGNGHAGAQLVNACSGGGGGANGGDGGRGANPFDDNGGDKVNQPAIPTLAGGGGGGGGAGGQGGVGGGGGGAIQVVANERITVTGGINVGGCGGKAANDCGGGGGAGGTVLLEAPVISFENSKLAANGGGGAGGNGGTAGETASLTNQRANGGAGHDTTSPPPMPRTIHGGKGGDGGDDEQANGSGGELADQGGAGGGGVGRMRFNTLSGGILTTGGYMFSPQVSTTGAQTTVTKGMATVH